MARNKPHCLSNETQGRSWARCHGVSCVCFSHKQDGLMLKRMVTKSEELEVMVGFLDLMEKN